MLMQKARQTIRFFNDLGQHEAGAASQDNAAPRTKTESVLMELLINAEWRIFVLEHAIDQVIASLQTNAISDEDLEKWREAGFEELQRKYPSIRLTIAGDRDSS